MLEDIQERMRALIAQHGNVSAILTALWQHLEAQGNDEQTDSFENHVPHIDVLVEFNQGTLESARERRNCLKRKRHAKQREQPFLHNLLSHLQGQGKIVLAVASSGIASLLFPSGRIAHSRFKIPIDLHDESTCNITQQMTVAKLVRKADLIIWDEAPMRHR
jgi:hypothetical protein